MAVVSAPVRLAAGAAKRDVPCAAHPAVMAAAPRMTARLLMSCIMRFLMFLSLLALVFRRGWGMENRKHRLRIDLTILGCRVSYEDQDYQIPTRRIGQNLEAFEPAPDLPDRQDH